MRNNNKKWKINGVCELQKSNVQNIKRLKTRLGFQFSCSFLVPFEKAKVKFLIHFFLLRSGLLLWRNSPHWIMIFWWKLAVPPDSFSPTPQNHLLFSSPRPPLSVGFNQCQLAVICALMCLFSSYFQKCQ